MRSPVIRLSVLFVVLLAVGVSGQAPQPTQAPPATQAAQASPAPTGDARFTGRWELAMQPPAGLSMSFENGVPMAIVDVTSADGKLSVKLVDSPLGAGKVTETAVKGDEFSIVCFFDGPGQTMTFRLKRVGDRLEGTGTPSGTPTDQTTPITGRITKADKVASPVPKPPSPEQKAYQTAVSKPRADRAEALKQFLKDYPETAMKDQASLAMAQSYEKVEDRIAALKKYIEDFPKSADQGRLQLALAPTARADKTAALKKYIEDYPKASNRERAEYELTSLAPAGAERLAAQETFVKAYPKSPYASSLQVALIEEYAKAKPVVAVKLNAMALDFIKGAPDLGMQFASRLNTVADRLMVNDAILDTALSYIQLALTAADKAPARTKATYVTTYGQVLFKQKKYDEAEKELKRGLELAGKDGEMEAQLYLGKIYEAKGNDDAALTAYFKAADMGSTKEIKTSLERAYTKKNGSLNGLDDKLDAIYKAKPRGFEPGHFTRKAEPGTPKVVLAELFTGAECPPCVAADMAFDGLAERFDRQTLAVLVYHLHIPGPDPMTNADTDARAGYYSANSTPTYAFDGLEPKAGGGAASGAPKLFDEMKGKVEARLAVAPQAALTGFQAKVKGQTITVTGKAALDKASVGKVKKATLHVVLAQDLVRYVGSNGVRFHTFVVRKLLNSTKGMAVPATGSSASFTGTVDLPALTAALEQEISAFEKKRSENAAFSFTERVTKFDVKNAVIVAFVQDDDTKTILQSVVVNPK